MKNIVNMALLILLSTLLLSHKQIPTYLTHHSEKYKYSIMYPSSFQIKENINGTDFHAADGLGGSVVTYPMILSDKNDNSAFEMTDQEIKEGTNRIFKQTHEVVSIKRGVIDNTNRLVVVIETNEGKFIVCTLKKSVSNPQLQLTMACKKADFEKYKQPFFDIMKSFKVN